MKEYHRPFEVPTLLFLAIANALFALLSLAIMLWGLCVYAYMPGPDFPWDAVSTSGWMFIKLAGIATILLAASRLVDRIHETHHIAKNTVK